MSSTCFETHRFILRETAAYAVWCVVTCIGVSSLVDRRVCSSVFSLEHTVLSTTLHITPYCIQSCLRCEHSGGEDSVFSLEHTVLSTILHIIPYCTSYHNAYTAVFVVSSLVERRVCSVWNTLSYPPYCTSYHTAHHNHNAYAAVFVVSSLVERTVCSVSNTLSYPPYCTSYHTAHHTILHIIPHCTS